jgi:pantoate--beta-alanine ligase
MRVIESIAEMLDARRDWASRGEVGLVPTMGFLHPGHLSLVRQASAENELVVVSIFVNPAQFDEAESFVRYPRDLPHDLGQLEGADVDIVFVPPATEMYPPGYRTIVEPTGPLAERLEGALHPSYFRGITTAMTQLFLLVRPNQVYVGQKDAQQAAVLARMIEDLHFPLSLRVLPILREADGLAMGSRNATLTAEQRAAAPVLFRALQAGRLAFAAHPLDGAASINAAMAAVIAAEPRAELEYADVCDPHTFEPLTAELRAPALLLVAARFGEVRLTDNFLLPRTGTWDVGIRVPA